MRLCPNPLKSLLDGKGLPTDLDPIELLKRAEVSLKGVHGNDPLIDLFRSSVALPASQAWCVDFQQACIAYVEETVRIKSPLPDSQSVLQLWNRSGELRREGAPGTLILWHLDQTWEGHCGLVLEDLGDHWRTVEGNTSGPSDELVRDGNGVHVKMRRKGGSTNFRELGFLGVF